MEDNYQWVLIAGSIAVFGGLYFFNRKREKVNDN
jgi:hypothetical protein